MLRILCFVGYYLPGYKGGGPIRTIENMVETFQGQFEFLIVTSDRDLSDVVPYPSVSVDQWNVVGHAKVFYASSATLTLNGLIRLLRETQHDILYLNGFFSPLTTILPMIICRLGLVPRKPTVLAPRGEFSEGALSLKTTKKVIWLFCFRLLGLYGNLIWQASSSFEAADIRRASSRFWFEGSVSIAPNLSGQVMPIRIAPDLTAVNSVAAARRERFPGPLRVIFLSRISKMKNLDYLLGVLKYVRKDMTLSIYGPKEDLEYWSVCKDLIGDLPSNIAVTYHGDLRHNDVSQAFADHDVFIFPTRGENFGHAIFESLAAGTAVLVSEMTPWMADPDGAVEVLDLKHPERWSIAINRWADFDENAFSARRYATTRYLARHAKADNSIELNRDLFLSAFGGRPIHVGPDIA